MTRKILLPYDFGNSFSNVPEQLQKLIIGDQNAKVVILNVISESELINYVRYQGKHFEDAVEEKTEYLKPFTDQLDELNIDYTVQFRSGRRITHVLLNEIKENDYDIVVMSNKRAKRDIKHVLGHVTHKVAKRVNTPVLIIK